MRDYVSLGNQINGKVCRELFSLRLCLFCLSWRRKKEEKAVLTDNSFCGPVMNKLFTETVISADWFWDSKHLNRECRKKARSAVTDTASYLHNFDCFTNIAKFNVPISSKISKGCYFPFLRRKINAWPPISFWPAPTWWGVYTGRKYPPVSLTVVNICSQDSIEKKQIIFSPELFYALSIRWCSHKSYL